MPPAYSGPLTVAPGTRREAEQLGSRVQRVHRYLPGEAGREGPCITLLSTGATGRSATRPTRNPGGSLQPARPDSSERASWTRMATWPHAACCYGWHMAGRVSHVTPYFAGTSSNSVGALVRRVLENCSVRVWRLGSRSLSNNVNNVDRAERGKRLSPEACREWL